MAWGDKKELITAENAAMKREIELLREQIADLKEDRANLRQQLIATQDALIAKESPEAYRDRKYEEEQALVEEPTEKELAFKERQQEKASIASRYISELENPLFKDADDMLQQLTRVVGTPLSDSGSLHGNNES